MANPANPVKSDEIEDVLSSIRRLVTEHQPHVEDADRNEPPLAADKLVLTPALRVTDPEDPWVPIPAQNDLSDEAGELPRGDGGDWAEELWGDEGSESNLDPQLQADIWEEGEAPAEPAPDLVAEPSVTGAAREDEESLFLPSDLTEEAAGDPALAAEAVAGAPKPADHADEFQPMAEAKDKAPPSFIRSSRSVIEYEPEEGNSAVPDEEPPVATMELAEARAAQMAVAGVMSDTAADPSETDASAVAQVDGVGEAEAPADSEQAADDLLADDAIEPEPQHDQNAPDDTGRGAEVEDLGESPFSFPDDEVSIVDEEMLREIISDVVRQELQGEMGKRITRNIRKLVRREIRIALATDELED